MSHALTASDRKALIKRASALPKGSEERRAILAGLKEAAPMGVTGTTPISGKLTVKRNGAVVVELDRIGGLDLDKYEGMGSMAAEMAAGLAGALEGSKVEWARPHGNGKVSFALS